MIAPKVFISYSHDSADHSDGVLGFANRLRADGIDATIDQNVTPPPEGWPFWMERSLADSDFVLMVCSELYGRRATEPEGSESDRGVKFEGSLPYQYLYSDPRAKNRFIPVLLERSDAKFIPPIVADLAYYVVDTDEGYYSLYRHLTGQPELVKPTLGEIATLPAREEIDLHGITVFLCHSSKDKPTVRELYRKLALNGAQPWLDEEDLLPGQEWEVEIPKAVRKADAVVVCLSANAVNNAGYFHKEIVFALDALDRQPEASIYLIPVKIGECEVPERLKHLHYVNITDNKGYEKLVRSLRARARQLRLSRWPKVFT
jgi:hypothetical protein